MLVQYFEQPLCAGGVADGTARCELTIATNDFSIAA